ncbi:MAG: chromate resistance protein [Alphaproteobacteria bacterium]|nr:chromate resistance protein [Alphaproteobacteria bacterium]
MPSPTQITPNQLNRLIGTPDAPVIIDVCIDEDYALDERFIPTAMRHPFDDIASLVPMLQGKRVVIVCKKGLKLGQGAAAVLRACGIVAESVEGGNYAWRDAGLPLVPAGKIPARNGEGRTVWVTKQRPKIDRIACPWLIRRFIDPNAQFLFVEGAHVLDVAEKFNATPFDVDGVLFGHRGEGCTFDTMLEEFALEIDALQHMAQIIRGADTNQPDLTAQTSGLLAISLGLSRMYKDDLRQLDAGMGIYDALYRWARDAVSERHDG